MGSKFFLLRVAVIEKGGNVRARVFRLDELIGAGEKITWLTCKKLKKKKIWLTLSNFGILYRQAYSWGQSVLQTRLVLLVMLEPLAKFIYKCIIVSWSECVANKI